MSTVLNGTRVKGIYIARDSRFNARTGCFEYQIRLMLDLELYNRGAWVRERDLKLGRKSVNVRTQSSRAASPYTPHASQSTRGFQNAHLSRSITSNEAYVKTVREQASQHQEETDQREDARLAPEQETLRVASRENFPQEDNEQVVQGSSGKVFEGRALRNHDSNDDGASDSPGSAPCKYCILRDPFLKQGSAAKPERYQARIGHS